VPPGVRLRRSGSLTITKAGAVVDRMDVHGCITVLASDVTIRRTRVRGGPCGADHGIDIGYGKDTYHGILIEDVEVDGQDLQARGAGIGNSGFTCRRCDIHGHARGIQTGSDVVVEDSYVHDLYGTQNSETAPFQTNGGSHLVLRHNTLEQNDLPTASTALALMGEFAPVADVLVEDNLFNGGGYCVYGGSTSTSTAPYPHASRVRFLHNAFGHKLYRKCGSFGPVAFYESGRGNRWAGNYWAGTKKVVCP
jgi:Right handed beta helix region